MVELTKEGLEKTLKDVLFYLDLYSKEAEARGEKVDDWAWNIEHTLRSQLGYDHSGNAGDNLASELREVLKCWLVLEVWENGCVMPRYIGMTQHEAEVAREKILDTYDRVEPAKRPKSISIEHQRIDHIFGLSMESGRLRMYSGMKP